MHSGWLVTTPSATDWRTVVFPALSAPNIAASIRRLTLPPTWVRNLTVSWLSIRFIAL